MNLFELKVQTYLHTKVPTYQYCYYNVSCSVCSQHYVGYSALQ